MQTDIAAERHGFADQAAAPLAERVIEALNGVRLAARLSDRTVPLRGEDLGVGFPVVCGDHRALPIAGRQGVPDALAGLRRTIPNGNANNVAGGAVKGEPHPDLLSLGSNE